MVEPFVVRGKSCLAQQKSIIIAIPVIVYHFRYTYSLIVCGFFLTTITSFIPNTIQMNFKRLVGSEVVLSNNYVKLM